jgi:hypothetical protein
MENSANDLRKKSIESGANESFGQILLEAIDEALSALGEGVQVSIYFYLEKKFKIRKHEIPQRVGEFSDALERILGLGTSHLEILFMKSLHSKIKLVCNWPTSCKWVVPEVTFQEYVRLMKQKFEEATANENKVELFVDAGEKQEQYG